MSETVAVAAFDTGPALRFPRECPGCGRVADTRFRTVKIFARRTGRGPVWLHHGIDVPACAACVREHDAIVYPDPDAARRAQDRQATQVLPIMGAGACLAGCGVLLATVGATAVARASSILDPATMASLGLGAAGTGLGIMAGSRLARRVVVAAAEWPDAQYAVELRSIWGARTVMSAPGSPLARSVDYSDNRADTNQLAWRIFSFARASYARQFSELNSQYVYDRARATTHPPLRRPPARRALYYAAGAALVAAATWLSAT